jgi:gas vesicle protein
MNTYTQADKNCLTGNSLCWSSVFAGIISALMVAFMLNLLVTSLGLISFKVDTASNPLAYGIGTVIWLMVSGAIAMWVGGWVAGKFSGKTTCQSGLMQGYLVSAISTFLAVTIVTTAAGAMLGGTFNIIGKSISSAGSAASSVSSSVSSAGSSVANFTKNLPPEIKDNIKSALPDVRPVIEKIHQQAEKFIADAANSGKEGAPSKDEIKQKLHAALKNFFASYDSDNNSDARSKLVDLLVDTSGKDKSEVESMVNDWQKSYTDFKNEMKDKAKAITDETTKIIGQFALLDFLILLVGIIAACFGGIQGTRSNCRE